jgi:MFS family permease
VPFSRALRICFYSFALAQIISVFGDRLHQFSVVGMIGRIDPGNAFELFLLAVFSYVPILIFAPIFGSLIDRADKALVLIVVDVIRGVVVLFVPALFYLMGNLYAFYIPVFLLSLANLWFSPAKSAIIPEVFGERYLLQINAVLWGLGIVGTLAGFLLGGWLFDFHSWEMSFYSDGASYLVSVVFLLPLLVVSRGIASRRRTASPAQVASDFQIRGIARSIRDGLGLIKDNRPVSYGLIVQMSLFASLGILYVIGIARIQSVFPPDKTIYLSAVASAGTIGLLAGSALTTLFRRWFSVNLLIALSTLVFSLAWIGVARTDTLVPMVVWALVMGVAVSPISILTETLLQVATPEAFRGRVFSTREVLTKTAFLVMSSLATLATAFITKEVIMLSIGVFLAGLGVLLASKNFLKA